MLGRHPNEVNQDITVKYRIAVPMPKLTKKPAPRQGTRANYEMSPMSLAVFPTSESTHLYAAETLDGKNWVAFPTLFQDPDGTWVDMSEHYKKDWVPVYEEAKRRGEVIDFGTNKEEAINWGEGSWKEKNEMSLGGSVRVNKMRSPGVQMLIGDPIPHQKKTRAMGPSGEIIYVPSGEGAMDDPDNYLNLEMMDAIIHGQQGDTPFTMADVRDRVGFVEAGPNSKNPYTQIQEVNTDSGSQLVRYELIPEYGSGKYMMDYPTAQTAYNRIKQMADKRDLDYPRLTQEQLQRPYELDPEIQDMLFTAHFAMDEATTVSDVLNDINTLPINWYTGHYKGSDLGKLRHFEDLMDVYEKRNK